MDSKILLKYDQRVPRYTSYPTAVQFTDTIGAEQHAAWLGEVGRDEPVSLYVHVPFCEVLCWYCGCNTQVGRHQNTFDNYTDLVCDEIDRVAAKLRERPEAAAVHWGGGTPSAIGPARMMRIMAKLREHFDFLPDAEIAVEMDPRVISAEDIVTLTRDMGVNRTSIGVQDFDEDVQKAVNRVQPYELVADAITNLRAGGIRDLNLDLMYGLPLQQQAKFGTSADLAVGLGPERMTLFGYAHVPWMFSHMKLIKDGDLPDAEARLNLFNEALERLAAADYVHIGLDHFSKAGSEMDVAQREGRLHRNFQGYTTDTAKTLLAFGASAISTLPSGFIQNKSAARDYMMAIKDGGLGTNRGVGLTAQDRLRSDIIERLMCDFKIDLEDICDRHNVRVEDLSGEVEKLNPLIADDLVSVDGWQVNVLPQGRMLVRMACAAFDEYHAPDPDKPAHARAI
ncbi:MAG: oxygen-independent coproporphyrinogen III oxidase [Alphaproteobacteria bacterium]|nr:oxygen-independent coproporphyrinogen III oxidase [Alphaproteobacteria bacterium]